MKSRSRRADRPSSLSNEIKICGARENNLKGLDLSIKRGAFVTFVGPSGSGKSSLLFQTLAAESSARAELLGNNSVRQLVGRRPDCDAISGLPFCTTVSQKSLHRSPRSTVATVTGLHAVLRKLTIAHGEIQCDCGEKVGRADVARISEFLQRHHRRASVAVMAVVAREPLPSLSTLEHQLDDEGIRRLEIAEEFGGPRRPRKLAGLASLDPNRIHAIVAPMGSSRASGLQEVLQLLEQAHGLGKYGVVVSIKQAGKLPPLEIDTGIQAVCAPCGRIHRVPDESLLSFNSHPSRSGRCARCEGLGVVEDFDPASLVPDPDLSVDAGCFALRRDRGSYRYLGIREDVVRGVCALHGDSSRHSYRRMKELTRRALLSGIGEVRVQPIDIAGKKSGPKVRYHGLVPALAKLLSAGGESADYARQFIAQHECDACLGGRFDPVLVARYRYGNRSFGEILSTDVVRSIEILKSHTARNPGERSLVDGALRRLASLRDAGVGYLGLNRSLMSLSGGEMQRLKIAASLHGGLTGAAYVLDEPSLGLHASDGAALISVIEKLRDAGNTILVADHDPLFQQAAERIIALGPGAGRLGGSLVSGQNNAAEPIGRRPRQKLSGFVEVKGCRANTLRNVTVKVPLGGLICLTGVSGSGKSSFAHGVLVPAIEAFLRNGQRAGRTWTHVEGAEAIRKVMSLGQRPIGASASSVVATYLDIYDEIRELFSKTDAARAQGMTSAHFSFNRPEGRCQTCNGRGISDDDDDRVNPAACSACNGSRFNEAVLDVEWCGHSIGAVLALPAEGAVELFAVLEGIAAPLRKLVELGVGHLQLGRPTTTLSGGEAQRLKLARSLCTAEGKEGGMLLVLDEPSAGLHRSDVARLLKVLDHLAQDGANTLLLIEHDLDLIEQADWIIDFGPGAGTSGGEVIYTGPVAGASKNPESRTGQSLSDRRSGRPHSAAAGEKRIIMFSGGLVENTVSDRVFDEELDRFRAIVNSGESSLAEVGDTHLDPVRPTFLLDSHARRFPESSELLDVLGERRALGRHLLQQVEATHSSVALRRPTIGMFDRREGAPGSCRHCQGEGKLISCDVKLLVKTTDAEVLGEGFLTSEVAALIAPLRSRLVRALGRFELEGLIRPRQFEESEYERGLVLFGLPGLRFKIPGRKTDKDVDYDEWSGLVPLVLSRLHLSKTQHWSERVRASQVSETCFACGGSGYDAKVAAFTIRGVQAPTFLTRLGLEHVVQLLQPRRPECTDQAMCALQDLVGAGLGHLNLTSRWRSLSETERGAVRTVSLKYARFAQARHSLLLPESVNRQINSLLQDSASDCEIRVSISRVAN